MRQARLLLFAALLLPTSAMGDDVRSATVGMSGRIDGVVLPGPELEVKPLDDARAPLVLRVVAVYPHGTAHRYDLVWYGLDPGEYDLKDYLRRKDGSSAEGLPSLRVEVTPVLPPGQVQPNPLEPAGSPRLGGYRVLLIVGVVVWVLGLLAILFLGRRGRKRAAAGSDRPLTVADRLRPLVERATRGELPQAERAELERTLLAFWRRRLGLEDARPAEAMAVLRAHPEAGVLLGQLEAWLHRPGPVEGVDVAALLKPYQAVREEALAAGTGGSS
jgi:hypothetical protein